MLSLARQTFNKRREDILDDFDGITAVGLIHEYKESYVVGWQHLLYDLYNTRGNDLPDAAWHEFDRTGMKCGTAKKI